MTSRSDGFGAFMAKSVEIKRSHLYLFRFSFLALVYTASGLMWQPVFLMRNFVAALAGALFVSTIGYLTDRYGNLSDRMRITLSLIILAVLAILIWRHEANKVGINKPYVGDPIAIRTN